MVMDALRASTQATIKLTELLARRNLEYALHYWRLGWSIIPVPPGAKKPRYDWKVFQTRRPTEDEVRKWWTEHPDDGIAVICGKVSGIIVLDLDAKHGGYDKLLNLLGEKTSSETVKSMRLYFPHDKVALDAAFAEIPDAPVKRISQHPRVRNAGLKVSKCMPHTTGRLHGWLPRTPESITGGNGGHFLFSWEEGIPNFAGRGLLAGLELWANDHYIILPPSLHESGRNYMWYPGLEPDSVEPAPLPEFLKHLKNERQSEEPIPVPRRIKKGVRNTTLIAEAGFLRNRGYSEEAILTAIRGLNSKQCEEPMEDDELKTIARSGGQMAEHPPLTDSGMARRVVIHHGSDLRYVHGWGWLVWDGRRWAMDDTGEVDRRVKSVVGTLEAEASFEQDSGLKSELRKAAKSFQADAKIKAIIHSSQSEYEIVARATDFDANPWLLNCQNGSLNLQNGGFHAHRREDLITKLIPVDYNEKSSSLLWERFVEKVLPDTEIRSFMQRVVGYALTGATSEQAVFFPYGEGSNGKTTFLETITALLNDYAAVANGSTFLQKRHETVGNDLARLSGKRLIFIDEAGQGEKLNESKIKNITGGAKVPARFLHREYFEFTPTGKILWAVNHRPEIQGQDLAIWRRVFIIPFTETISDNERIKDYTKTLQTELTGVLSWAVDGCKQWQKQGLNPPEVVKAAVDQFREEMQASDLVSAFVEECCERDRMAGVVFDALYNSFKPWCYRNEAKPLSKVDFARRLGHLGYRSAKVGGQRGRSGLRLRT